jgi:drug/metabolite transporter (DMT)-like permease
MPPHPASHRLHTGVHLSLLATMMTWGLNLSAIKVMTASLDFLLVGTLRMGLAAIVLAAIARHQRVPWPRWSGRTLILGLLAAFLLVYFQQVTFARGMNMTSATNAALTMALGPMFSVLLEGLLFRRPIRLAQMLGIGLGLTGVAVVILSRAGASLTEAAAGDLWILASVIGFALGGACMQKLSQDTPTLAINVFAHAVGTALLCLHTAVAVPQATERIAGLDAWMWTLLVFSGLFATALGAVVWAKGISTLGVGRTASYLSWVPVFGVLFGALVLGESLTVWHLVGMVCVLLGSTLAVRRPRLMGHA